MKITILQSDIVWANQEANIQQMDDAINRNPCSDIYVLPEMFSTGFYLEPAGVAETMDGMTLRWMRSKAQEKNAAILGSVLISDGDRYFNRFCFVYPNGDVSYYDKRHLFTYGGEHRRFTAGQKRVVVEFRGVRMLLQICYDLRFPVWARNLGDYDMIIYVANWPTSRIHVWNTLLVARAIENQCFVVGVNRVGADPSCEYCGGSAIISPYGRELATCEGTEPTEVTIEIDMELLKSFRQKFPVLNDADAFYLR